MPRPGLELAEIFRRHGAAFRRAHALPLSVQRVMRDIERCRTAALGGHLDRCTACGHQAISYNSCRNRHCPKCQGASQLQWLADRERELLPVPYFHAVFTFPDALLSDIAFQNKRLVYRLLFKENYPKQISEQDRHYVVKDAQERVVGGLCFRIMYQGVAYLDSMVVASSLKRGGIGGAVLEDFCGRMASAGVNVVLTHGYLSPFFLHRGFKVDKQWGALVRYL